MVLSVQKVHSGSYYSAQLSEKTKSGEGKSNLRFPALVEQSGQRSNQYVSVYDLLNDQPNKLSLITPKVLRAIVKRIRFA